MRRLGLGLAALAMAALAGWSVPLSARATHVMFVGTYTGPASKGIYAFRFDDGTGGLTPVGLVAETPSPSFLTQSADGRFLFAVNEMASYQGARSGSVSSFTVDRATAKLAAISVQASKGADPCHLMLDATGRFLAVANYTGGNFAMFPVDGEGRIAPAKSVFAGEGSGPDRARQTGPHAHETVFDSTNKFLIGADLGIDRLLVYKFDAASGAVTPNTTPAALLPPGSGPRHLAFTPDNKTAFVISELASTITSFSWNGASGVFTKGASVSTLPADFKGTNATAEIAVHPNGRFVYGSNRGHDSIAVFAIGANGALTLAGHTPTRGKTPRNFTIDPSGRWLIAANQDTGTLAVFSINERSGMLTPTGPLAEVGSPVSLLFLR